MLFITIQEITTKKKDVYVIKIENLQLFFT